MAQGRRLEAVVLCPALVCRGAKLAANPRHGYAPCAIDGFVGNVSKCAAPVTIAFISSTLLRKETLIGKFFGCEA